MNTGIILHLYTTKEELNNAKSKINTIVGWSKSKRPDDAIYHISIPFEICDVLENEVRINLFKIENELERLGLVIGKQWVKNLRMF